MRQALCCAGALLAAAVVVGEASALSPGDPVSKVIPALEKWAPKPSAIFVGACSYRDRGPYSGSVYLIMPVGRGTGFMIDVITSEKPHVSPNGGDVRFEKGRAVVYENLGGPGLTDWYRRSVQKVADTKMSVVGNYAAALAYKPSVSCPPEIVD
jgi:hypothetical protein